MSFVAAASTVGAWAGIGAAGSTAAIIGGGALIGAGVGGTYSALTGDGKILDSMLTGAGIGGLGAWGLNAAGVSAGVAAPTSTLTGAGALTSTPAGQAALASNTPAVAAYGNTAALDAASGSLASGSNLVPAGASNSFGLGATGATNTGLNSLYPGAAPSGMTSAAGLSGAKMLGYGLGATTLMGLMGGQPKGVNAPSDKGMIRPYEYGVAKRETEGGKPYYFEPIEYDKYGNTTKPLDTSERNYFTQNYTPLPTYKAAMGGQVPPHLENMSPGGLAAIQGMRDGYSPMTTRDGNIPQFGFGGMISKVINSTKIDNNSPRYSFDPETRKYTKLNSENRQDQQYAGNGLLGRLVNSVVNQAQSQKTSNKVNYDPSTQRYSNFAAGGLNEGGMTDGNLGGYAEGQLLKGPGDGVSDDIPATINGKQPARLADGEFVIPARIVSELGNGSTDAGAKRLYEMMERIQADRKKTVGKGKVAVDSKAKKHLPA